MSTRKAPETIRNRTVAQLSQWAADPQKMARFEAVALLCQRTSFVKQLLGLLNDNDDVIRLQIQAVCARNGIETSFPRGNPMDGFHFDYFTSQQRYGLSFLLNTLMATNCGGIEPSEDGLDSENLVDRLIYSYRRYLLLAGVAASKADVSLEMFYMVYRAYVMGQIDLTGCNNCGSAFVNLRVSQSVQCPLCVAHNHAQIPGKSQPAHSVANTKRRSYA